MPKDAKLIACATTAAAPLFDGALVPDGTCVVAIGSHTPERRELDYALVRRAQLVVEDTGVALREAGDPITATGQGAVDPHFLAPMRNIITGQAPVDSHQLRVFKSSGMSWEDLVIAAQVYRAG